MFALLIEPQVMSICGPDCYAPFWELTTLRALALASPHLCSAFHRLSCAQKTYFSHISIILPAPPFPKSSAPLTYLSSSFTICSCSGFSCPKEKGRNPSVIPDCAVNSFTNTSKQFISANSAAPHSSPRRSVAFVPTTSLHVSRS